MDGFQRQYLESGKILSGKSFPNFVRTWNWLVNFCSNLSGDSAAVGDGKIEVDRADADHPVIRITTRGNAAESGGSSEATPTWESGRFRITAISPESVTIDNLVVIASGKYYGSTSTSAVTLSVDSTASTVYIYAELTPASNAIEVKAADTMPDGRDSSYTIVRFPLYTIEDGKVTLDWRIGPFAAVYI